MDAFEAYKIYLALKSHFSNKNYDYFKYGGRTKASRKSFESRSDKYFFNKLASKKDEIVNRLVANFINGDVWVGDVVNEQESEDRYRAWKKRQDSLSYIFSNELDKLDDNFNNNLQVNDGQHPHLLKMYLKQDVSPETLLIINDLTNVFRYWNKNITDTIIWPHHCFTLKKYRPFFTVDLDRYRSIVLSKFDK